MEYCYLDGEITRYADCSLHVSDLLVQRGYGIFEFFRVRQGQIPWLGDYADRLFRSIGLSGIAPPFTRNGFLDAVHSLLERNGNRDSAFKVLVTGGRSDNLATVTGNSTWILLHVPWTGPPEETREKGVNLISDQYRRPNPEIKTLFYFNYLRLQEKMKRFDAVDVLYHTGTVTETSRANLFFVENGNVHTPDRDVLHGITRKQVLEKFREIRMNPIEFEQIFDMDEIFLTSTSRDITPVVSIDGRRIGSGVPGPVTREIQHTFRNA